MTLSKIGRIALEARVASIDNMLVTVVGGEFDLLLMERGFILNLAKESTIPELEKLGEAFLLDSVVMGQA